MDFIVEDGVLKAYVGSSDCEELIIPEGVQVIGGRFAQSVLQNVKIVIPASVEVIEECAFDRCGCRELVFEEGSKLEEMYDYPEGVPFIKVPESCKEFGMAKAQEQSYYDFYAKKNTVLVLPQDAETCSKAYKSIRHLFIAKKLYDKELENFKGVHYIYDGFDYASIKHVDKMATEGVRYIATNKGAVIIDFDNNIAKWQDIPEFIDGMPVLAFNVLSPEIERADSYYNFGSDYGMQIDSFKNTDVVDEVRKKAGDVFPKLRYKAVSERKKLDDIAVEYNSARKLDDVLGGGRPRKVDADYDHSSEEGKKADKAKKLSDSMRKLNGLKHVCLWVGLLFAITFGLLIFVDSPVPVFATYVSFFVLSCLVVIAGVVIAIIQPYANKQSRMWRDAAVKKYAEEQKKLKAEKLAKGKIKEEEPDVPHCEFIGKVNKALPLGYKKIAVDIMKAMIDRCNREDAEAAVAEYRLKQTERELQNAVNRYVSGGRETYNVKDKDGHNIGTIEKK